MNHELEIVVWPEVRPTGASKYTKSCVVWFNLKKPFSGCFIINDTTRQYVDKMDGGEECLIPKFEGHRCASYKSKTNLYDVSVLRSADPFCW